MKTATLTCTYEILSFDELTVTEQELVNVAKAQTGNSYAPYSKFCVGAALLLEDGTMVGGNNQENCAYPSGLCAERTALFHAHSQYPHLTIRTLAIAAFTKGSFCGHPITPCGNCRQVLLEYEKLQGSDITVLLYGDDEIYRLPNSRCLLPLQFDSL
jgi:cytidine deaminase